MDQFGTDAVRIALLISAAAGHDPALSEDRMKSGRGFANKLWNASRLLFMNMETSGITNWAPGAAAPVSDRRTDNSCAYEEVSINAVMLQHVIISLIARCDTMPVAEFGEGFNMY